MKATAYDFAASVDQQIDSLKSNEYLRKLGRAKILREELYPLSRLALCFKRPGTNVFVEAFENSGHADGSIQITGFIDREFEVQITFGGYSYEDALRDELLVAQGSSPGAGEIYRDKRTKKIITTTAALDYDEHIERVSNAIVERIEDKAQKSYPEHTVLLIAFEDCKLSGRGWWSRLFATLETKDKTIHGFAHVYLFNGWTSEIYFYR